MTAIFKLERLKTAEVAEMLYSYARMMDAFQSMIDATQMESMKPPHDPKEVRDLANGLYEREICICEVL